MTLSPHADYIPPDPDRDEDDGTYICSWCDARVGTYALRPGGRRIYGCARHPHEHTRPQGGDPDAPYFGVVGQTPGG